MYNLMTGAGFGKAFSGGWIMAWFGLLIIVVIIMLCKKWLGEEEMVGYPFNWLGSLFGGVFYFIIITLTGSTKWSLLAGIIGVFVGGFGAAMFGGRD